MTTTAKAEHRSFEADVSRLLHMMVHSVYSDRDVFLRELISNAADACEKLRYEAIGKACRKIPLIDTARFIPVDSSCSRPRTGPAVPPSAGTPRR